MTAATIASSDIPRLEPIKTISPPARRTISNRIGTNTISAVNGSTTRLRAGNVRLRYAKYDVPDKPREFGSRKPAKRAGGSATLRNTSAAYQRLRERLLGAEPLCRYCRHHGRITIAAILDHIVALSLGGGNDPDNLAPACKDCNDQKGKLEQRYLRRGYAIEDVANDAELGTWIRIGLAGPARD